MTVYGTLYHNETKNNQFGTNKEDILKCRNILNKNLICKVKLIIIENKNLNLDCQVNGSLSCDKLKQPLQGQKHSPIDSSEVEIKGRHNINSSVEADVSEEDSEEDDSITDEPLFDIKIEFSKLAFNERG